MLYVILCPGHYVPQAGNRGSRGRCRHSCYARWGWDPHLPPPSPGMLPPPEPCRSETSAVRLPQESLPWLC